MADVCVRMSLQEGLFQPQDRQGREVHAVLSADRGRVADGVLGDLRGPVALPGTGPLRRRPGARSRVGPRRQGPLRGAAANPVGPQRSPGDRRRARGGDLRRVDRGRPALADLCPDQHLQGGATAASGIPHHADGLVHPAAVAGGRRRQPRRPRRRGPGQPVRGVGIAAHPHRVPGRVVHRRGHRPGRGGAAQAGRHAVLHARHQPGAGHPAAHSGVGRSDRGTDVQHVPPARDREIRRAVCDSQRLCPLGAEFRGARLFAGLRRRARHVRVRPVRRGQRRAGGGRGRDVPCPPASADLRGHGGQRRAAVPDEPAQLGRPRGAGGNVPGRGDT